MFSRYKSTYSEELVPIPGVDRTVQCLSELATLLAISDTGMDVEDAIFAANERVSAVREEWGLSPEDIQDELARQIASY